MTREEFNKNSYLVNNNALYNKHTEHISTTEPIFIDGMAGSDNVVHERGGDASQNTYWAYEYESGKFLLGKFNEDDIKVKCETDSSDLWIVDAEGVYIEQDALNSYMESDCLNAINAKYGTSFSQLTMEKVTSIAIGDDCPDWNAYEKIEMEQIKVAIYAGSAQYIFGYVKGSECSISVTSSNFCNVCNNEGEIRYPQGGPSLDDNIKNMIRYKLSAYNVENITSMIESYEQDQVIDNWDEYTIIQ